MPTVTVAVSTADPAVVPAAAVPGAVVTPAAPVVADPASSSSPPQAISNRPPSGTPRPVAPVDRRRRRFHVRAKVGSGMGDPPGGCGDRGSAEAVAAPALDAQGHGEEDDRQRRGDERGTP